MEYALVFTYNINSNVLGMLQMVKSQYENVVPLTIPAKGGGTQSVRVVLTSSKEDRDLFKVVYIGELLMFDFQ